MPVCRIATKSRCGSANMMRKNNMLVWMHVTRLHLQKRERKKSQIIFALGPHLPLRFLEKVPRDSFMYFHLPPHLNYFHLPLHLLQGGDLSK